MLGAEDVGDEEGDHRQHEGHGNITGEVGTTWKYHYEAEEIHEEYEEKHRQQVGRKLCSAVLESGFDHSVVDEGDDGLHDTGDTARGFVAEAFVPSGHTHHSPKHEEDSDEKERRRFWLWRNPEGLYS